MATVVAPRPRSGSRRRWWIIAVIIAVVLIGICAAGAMLLRNAGGQPTGASGWTTTAATSGAIEASVIASGSIAPQAQAELTFAAEGTITEILVRPGDAVQAGQALARIDPADAQLTVTSAQADYEQAQAGYN